MSEEPEGGRVFFSQRRPQPRGRGRDPADQRRRRHRFVDLAPGVLAAPARAARQPLRRHRARRSCTSRTSCSRPMPTIRPSTPRRSAPSSRRSTTSPDVDPDCDRHRRADPDRRRRAPPQRARHRRAVRRRRPASSCRSAPATRSKPTLAAYGSGAVARSIREPRARHEHRHRRRHLEDRGVRGGRRSST